VYPDADKCAVFEKKGDNCMLDTGNDFDACLPFYTQHLSCLEGQNVSYAAPISSVPSLHDVSDEFLYGRLRGDMKDLVLTSDVNGDGVTTAREFLQESGIENIDELL